MNEPGESPPAITIRFNDIAIPTMKTSARITTLVCSLLLTGALAASTLAQSSTPVNLPYPCHLASSKNIQKELVKPLQSSSDAVREEALTKIIQYGTHYGAALDLTPTVNGLLHVYANDRNPQFRIMAVQALYRVGDRRGMEELYALTQRELLSPRIRKIGENASKLYFASLRNQQLMERHTKLAQRHAEKAEQYRKRGG